MSLFCFAKKGWRSASIVHRVLSIECSIQTLFSTNEKTVHERENGQSRFDNIVVSIQISQEVHPPRAPSGTHLPEVSGVGVRECERSKSGEEGRTLFALFSSLNLPVAKSGNLI